MLQYNACDGGMSTRSIGDVLRSAGGVLLRFGAPQFLSTRERTYCLYVYGSHARTTSGVASLWHPAVLGLC